MFVQFTLIDFYYGFCLILLSILINLRVIREPLKVGIALVLQCGMVLFISVVRFSKGPKLC